MQLLDAFGEDSPLAGAPGSDLPPFRGFVRPKARGSLFEFISNHGDSVSAGCIHETAPLILGLQCFLFSFLACRPGRPSNTR
jgi:hypothetical protein